MEIGKYINEKVDQFKKNHYYMGYLANVNDSYLKKRWKDELRQSDLKWQKINCNSDVLALIDRFEGEVSFVEKNVKIGHIEDAFNMSLALHNALQGLQKLARFVEPSPWSKTQFSRISAEEVDAIFYRLESITERMNELNMQRAMQD